MSPRETSGTAVGRSVWGLFAGELGISPERVRQIEARTLGKLRHAIELYELDSTPEIAIH